MTSREHRLYNRVIGFLEATGVGLPRSTLHGSGSSPGQDILGELGGTHGVARRRGLRPRRPFLVCRIVSWVHCEARTAPVAARLRHAGPFLGGPCKPPSTLDENADRFVGHEDNHVLWPLGCSEQMHMSIWRDGLPFLCFSSAFALLSLYFHSTPNGPVVHTDARVPGHRLTGSACPCVSPGKGRVLRSLQESDYGI